MFKKYIEKYREFEKGKNSYMIDIVLFSVIVLFFHQLFKYYTNEIMAIPVVSDSALWLAHNLYDISLWINRKILGIEIIRASGTTMWFANHEGLEVNRGCSGLKQYLQVIVLFALLRGPAKHKIWFIPFSILVMFLTNIVRIAVLSIAQSWKPEYAEFIHSYVMRPFFYVVMIGLWIWWVEKFRRKA